LPLPWFRRLARRGQEAPVEAAADQRPETVAPPPADADGDPTTRKRRRGSRGGRGRRSSERREDAGAERKPEPAARAKAAPERRESRARAGRRPQPARKPLPPARRELLVSVDVGEQRVAVLEDGRPAELYLERPERRSIAGNIYKGTVDNVLPGMEAAFVEVGLEKNGFLYVDEIVVPELEGRRHGRKIQDLLARGQEVLVQAVKDPMKGKGARLTTEISLPGRFLVYTPLGEGVGVSRRLEDAERTRLREILKGLEPPKGGVIVRTAAEGASAEDIEADLRFLERLWKAIQQHAKQTAAPAVVYEEAELPLRVVRDLFTEDFEQALVEDERTFKSVVGYLKKTSPHMVERVHRYKSTTPLMEAHGVEDEIRSTLSRRVDLPSGGYLIFDYAEAFTVIDVNTGRFTGSRSKSSAQRLEDTITKNNLEAVKEVVHQLRLRDIGGIIVIDFIDMANPKNRATVEEALRGELERDRTKTYVVEISPLGLVEMTRQNVTEGPREMLTARCPTCEGDGFVISAESAALEIERRLRSLAVGARAQAFRVELNDRVAAQLLGPEGLRLAEIEERARRRFLLEPKGSVPLDHFQVVQRGKRADLVPELPLEPGQELDVRLVEVGRHDAKAGVGKIDGHEVAVAQAANLVGKRVKARVQRIVGGMAFAALVSPAAPAAAPPPITAESMAERPTRTRRKKAVTAGAATPPPEVADQPAAPADAADAEGRGAAATAEEKTKRKTRRGSRGGRRRKKASADSAPNGSATAEDTASAAGPTIHLPDRELGRAAEASDDDVEVVQRGGAAAPDQAGDVDGEQPPAPKRKARRGSRGGRRRRKAGTAATAAQASDGE
jgi:ribonuclease G